MQYDVVLSIITGKFKDEMGGKAIQEFVGLRSKMYSIKAKDGEQKNTAKGVSRNVSEDVLTHQDYLNCLQDKTSMKNKMTRFVHDRHQIYTVDQVETQGNEKNNITWKIQKQKYREKNLTENTENWTLKERRKIT